jgi:hypothetical protein
MKQKDSHSCGVLVIAFAHCLYKGYNLDIIKFKSTQLRGHLINCLEKGVFEEFPQFKPK